MELLLVLELRCRGKLQSSDFGAQMSVSSQKSDVRVHIWRGSDYRYQILGLRCLDSDLRDGVWDSEHRVTVDRSIDFKSNLSCRALNAPVGQTHVLYVRCAESSLLSYKCTSVAMP